MKYTAQPVHEGKASHGECAWWDNDRGVVFWMDCTGGRVFTYDPATEEKKEYPLPFNPAAIIPCEDGGFVAASEDTVYLLDEGFGIVHEFTEAAIRKTDEHFNDCKCGPDGSFYLGTMGSSGKKDGGRLYRLGTDGNLSVVLDKVGVSNGLAWSKDEKTFYYTDTVNGEIYAYDFDPATNSVTGKRVIFRDEALLPDGFCLDEEDNIWVALWGSRKAICVDTKTGEILHEVFADAPLTSSAVFGGKALDTLFITASRQGMTEEDLERDPLSGSLFAAKVDVKGALMYKGRFVTR